MNKSIAIIIPVFNEIFFTKQCLGNLKEAIQFYQLNNKEHFDVKVILIDDGSSDGTSDWVMTNYPETIILQGDGSLFWSGGINMGIDYILEYKDISHALFWNKDLYLEEDYLNILHDRILKEPDDVIIASKMLRKNAPDILFSCGGLFNPRTGKKINIGSGEVDGEKYNEVKKIDWCGGMAVAIPVEVFKKIGGCDNINFPQYDGDTDFFLRAKKAGFNLYLFPDLKAWNIHENTGRKEKFSLKNYLWYLNNIRSYKNININYRVLKIHSVGILPYIYFVYTYIIFSLKYFVKIVRSYFR